MTERPVFLGQSDLLGHLYVPEDHQVTPKAPSGCTPEQLVTDDGDTTLYPRRAKSIMLSVRSYFAVLR